MKTIIIWDGAELICFFVVDGDYSRLDNVYINTDDEAENELNDLIFDDDGNYRHKRLKEFPMSTVLNAIDPELSVRVIVAGIMP